VIDPIVEAHDLQFAYPGSSGPLIESLDLTVDGGEMVAVLGPSGCGKSTLLYLLGLFLRPTAGQLTLVGRETTRLGDDARSQLRAHQIGFVFQDAGLHGNWSVEENVAEGALYAGLDYRAAIARARVLLATYGIGDLAGRRPTTISGGQAQRVALCRALVRRPSVVLADEPTGNLDSASAQAVLGGLRAAARAGAAILVVTHAEPVAAQCDQILRLR